MIKLFFPFFFILTLVFSNSSASAGVIVFDDVVPVKTTVKLTALTKGRFFPEGGRLVTFYIEEKKIGTTMSGGDGFAFLKYSAHSSGIMKLRVEAGGESDEGALLVTRKKDKVIMIGMDSTLFENILVMEPMKDSRQVLDQLSKNFKIVYLSSFIGTVQSKKWLNDNTYPLSPILKWEGTEMLDDLQVRGVNVYAIIASPEILSEASLIERRFSFGETEAGMHIKDWNDLIQLLQAGGPD